MYGGTTPITEAGTLAVLNAELLAGLIYSQLLKESTPVILGSLPAGFNMEIMGSYYSTSSYLMNLACAELMDFYNIPHCGTSGSGMGRGPDLLASGNLWLNHLSSCLGKVGIAPFVGGNFDSTAFSPATVVLSDYIISKARKFSNGFVLNDSTTNVKEIDAIGHGGNFLTSEQTLASLYEFADENNFWQSMNHNTWKEQGNPDTKKFLIDYSLELYKKAETESLKFSNEIKKGEKFIERIIKNRKL
jgi:trimethylamine--corrinoid protein Co-methyltransferase